MLKIAVMALALATLAGAAAAGRLDPCKSDRVVLDKNGRPVAGANQAGLPPASGEVVKHRAGGDPGSFHKSPGRTKFEPITLERGLTHDSDFANWASGAGGGHHAGRRGHGPHHPRK